MTDLRFDGRVAVVTGAGRGLGRAYARLLAERGASVVVNDLGSSMEGAGSDAGPASLVVEEIVNAGGTAVSDINDISTAAGAEALIDRAVSEFGKIDILVNNAGIVRYGTLPELDVDHVASHLDVHLLGSFNTMRAAWPHFVAKGYGRVVHTTSSGIFGLENNIPYAAAKAGTIGMARSARLAGEPHNIKVNLIAPAAQTRMAGGDPLGDQPEQAHEESFMPPSAVAPMVAVLCHESCPVSGEIYAAGAGRFARVFIGHTQGYLTSESATAEDVVAHWGEINDESGYYVPADLMSWSGAFLTHLFAQDAETAQT